MSRLKALVIGYGSIGKRHTKNLMNYKPKPEISICTKNKEVLPLEKKGIKIYSTITDAIKQKHDVVLICNETNLHVKTAIKFAKKNYHIFLEKPMSDSLQNIPSLIRMIKNRKLITMVGCNMRFHSGIKLMKQLIDKKEIGRVVSVSVENGSFMPDWHPWENYRISYAAQKKLGGGVVLTQIHEIDYLHWFFGEAIETYSFTGKLSNLEIDVEDYASCILKFKNKVIAEVHLDYFQKPSTRNCKIIGTKGQIRWDWENNHVQLYKNKQKKWMTKKIEKKFDSNQMYVDELNYFLNCIMTKKTPMNSIIHALEPQKISLAIKKSSKIGKKVRIK